MEKFTGFQQMLTMTINELVILFRTVTAYWLFVIITNLLHISLILLVKCFYLEIDSSKLYEEI